MLGHKFDYSLKIVVVGDSGVGKTCYLLRYVRDVWEGEIQPTLGVEFLTKVVQTEKHRIQLQLWDTAGQELFRSVTRGYYRGSAGAIIVFSLDSMDSFENVSQWLRDIKDVASNDVVAILIGNKSDLKEERKVPQSDIDAFVKANNLLYFETSAKTGEGIFDSVNGCVSLIEKKVEDGSFHFHSTSKQEINFHPEKKTKSCC